MISKAEQISLWKKDLYEQDLSWEDLRQSLEGHPNRWHKPIERWTEIERWLAVHYAGCSPYSIKAVLDFCLYGHPDQAIVAIKNPSLCAEDLLAFLRRGKEALLLANSWRGGLLNSGIWYLYTEGVCNPLLDLMILADPNYKEELYSLFGCDYRELREQPHCKERIFI